MRGIDDSAGSSYGTVNGTITHTQLTPGQRVSLGLPGSNAPEVHGRFMAVSSASDFTHVIGTISSFSPGIEMGAFFTDGAKAAVCGLLGSAGNNGEALTGYGVATSTGPQSPYTLTAGREWPPYFAGPIYWQLSWVSSARTMSCSVSNDGYVWSPVWSDSMPYLTPIGIGYYLNNDFGTDFNSYLTVWGYR